MAESQLAVARLPDLPDVTVTARGALHHLCPFRGEEDVGSVSITWIANGTTLELHALASFLRTFSDQVISHEDLTGLIFDRLSAEGLRILSVVTDWSTAGLAVTVSRAARGDALSR